MSTSDEAAGEPEKALPYFAFLSYRSSDDRIARWLHSKLEQYRVPRSLVGTKGTLGMVPSRLRPIFRDRDDARVAGDLETILAQELSKSAQLVVVCSPEAAATTSWVNREIDIFRQRRPGAPVHAVIAGGEPPACFPAPLLTPNESASLREPLAADMRSKRLGGKDGRRRALIKLVAALIGVQFDELWRRERRRWWTRLVVGGVALIALGATIAFTFQHITAVSESRRLATHAINLTERQFDLALLLAADAYATSPTEEAEESLFHVVLDRPQLRGLMPAGTQVALSPDGKLIAIGDTKGKIHVYAAPSNELRASLEDERESRIRGLRFSKDGSRLASLSESGNIQVVDLRTKVVLGRFQAGFSGFGGLAFDYDSSDTFGTVHATGGFPEPACPLAFSLSGHRIAFIDTEGFLQVADVDTGAIVQRLGAPREADLRPRSLSFNADATALAAATPTKVEVWSIQSPSNSPAFQLNTKTAADIAFMSNDAVTILGNNGRLTGVDTKGGKILFEADAHSSQSKYSLGNDIGALVSWAGGTGTVVTSSIEGEIAAWRYSDLIRCQRSECKPRARFSRVGGGHLSSLAVSQDAVWIATAANEGTVERYSTLGADELAQPIEDMQDASLFAVASDSSVTAFGNRHRVLLKSTEGVVSFDVPTQCKPATELVLSPDARWVAIVSDRAVCARNVANSMAPWVDIPSPPSGMELWPPGLVFNRDGALLAARYRAVSGTAASTDNVGAIIWNLKELTVRPHTIPGVTALGFSGTTTLVIQGANGSVGEVDALTGIPVTLRSESLRGATGAWSYSTVDNVLYSAGNPGIIVRSDLKAHLSEEFFQSANRPAGEYLRPAVSSDGARIAIANGDGEISLWTRDGRRLGGSIVLAPPHNRVRRLAFSGGHVDLLIQQEDNRIFRIDLRPERWAALARERAGRALSESERGRYIRSSFRPAYFDPSSVKQTSTKRQVGDLDACFVQAPSKGNILSKEQIFVPLECNNKLRDVVSLVRDDAGSLRDGSICNRYSAAILELPLLLSDAQSEWAQQAIQRHDIRTSEAFVLLGLSGTASHTAFLDTLRREDFTQNEWTAHAWAKAFLARQGRDVATTMNRDLAASIKVEELLAWPECIRPAVGTLMTGSSGAPATWPRLRQAQHTNPSEGAYIELTRKGAAGAFTLMADLMMTDRSFDSARVMVARGLAESPADAGALNLAGLIELRSNQCASALEYFRRSLVAGRKDGWPQYNTAICLERLGRADEAEAAYLAALAKDIRPRFDKERAIFLDGYARFVLRQHQNGEALTIAESNARQAVDITSQSDSNFLDTLANIQFVNGNVAGAIETETKAISIGERNGNDTTLLRQTLETFRSRPNTSR